MTRFIETENGWVNLAEVRTIKEGHSKDARQCRYVLIDKAGDAHVVTSPIAVDWLRLDGRFLPAAAGAKATIVYFPNRDERPTADDIRAYEQPIIGWHVVELNDYQEPIFPEPVEDDSIVLVHMPDGRLLHMGDGYYDNLPAAKDLFLREHQDDWDRAHPGKTATSAGGFSDDGPDK